MKKIISIAVLCSICFAVLHSYANKSYSSYKINEGITIPDEINWIVETNETLTNKENGQTLYLYTDGGCVVRTSDGRGEGRYRIENSTIIINWDNGASSRGSVNTIRLKGVTRVESVWVEGVKYSQRFVVSR